MTLMSEAAIPSLDAQREWWNERSGQTPLPNAWQLRRGNTVLGLLRELPLKNPKIVDYESDTGWVTAEVAKIGNAVGVDLSETAIQEARRRYTSRHSSLPTFLRCVPSSQ